MQIIGHRGAKALAPENTIAGIKFALRRGVDWVEFDVRSTKDNKLVVIHDMTLLRLARRGQRVRDCTLSQLRKLATTSGETIPTFDEVMQAIGTKAKVNIEIKETRCARQLVQAIQRYIQAGHQYSDFLVSSLGVTALYTVQRLDPKLPLAHIHALWPFTFLTLPGLRLSAVGFYGFVAPKVAISLAKRRGLWTIVYTINHRSLAKHFEQKGIDAIITDRPDAFLSLWPLLLRWTAAVLLLLLVGYVIWLGFG